MGTAITSILRTCITRLLTTNHPEEMAEAEQRH
jgi:hypothetical protein